MGESHARFQGVRPCPSPHQLSSSATRRDFYRADHSPKPRQGWPEGRKDGKAVAIYLRWGNVRPG